MITLCIRYTINQNQLSKFEEYARSLPEPIRRSGGELIGYFLPTKLAGPTNTALALINFQNLDAYEKYRAALAAEPGFRSQRRQNRSIRMPPQRGSLLSAADSLGACNRSICSFEPPHRLHELIRPESPRTNGGGGGSRTPVRKALQLEDYMLVPFRLFHRESSERARRAPG